MKQTNRKFDLSTQCGFSIDIPENATEEDKDKILSDLIQDANSALRPECVFEIREGMKEAGDRWAAWAYAPVEPYNEESEFRNPQSGEVTHFTHPGVTLQQEPLFMKRLGKGEYIKHVGYYLVGRAKT